jgi:hypothetical protein
MERVCRRLQTSRPCAKESRNVHAQPSQAAGRMRFWASQCSRYSASKNPRTSTKGEKRSGGEIKSEKVFRELTIATSRARSMPWASTTPVKRRQSKNNHDVA